MKYRDEFKTYWKCVEIWMSEAESTITLKNGEWVKIGTDGTPGEPGDYNSQFVELENEITLDLSWFDAPRVGGYYRLTPARLVDL